MASNADSIYQCYRDEISGDWSSFRVSNLIIQPWDGRYKEPRFIERKVLRLEARFNSQIKFFTV